MAPTPVAIADACRYSAAISDWRALCPTQLPQPFVGHPPIRTAGVMVVRKPPLIVIGLKRTG